MDEQSQSSDVDKLVAEFLSELNALGSSLGPGAAGSEPDRAEESGNVEPAAPIASGPEEPPAPAAAEPQPESTPDTPPPAATPNYYRNIDILLMDEAQPTPLRKKPDEYEFPYNYRSLYRSRFWLFKHPRFFACSAGLVVLAGLIAVVYFRDPFGVMGGRPSQPAASALEPASITPAVAIDRIVPQYPPRARKLGIKGVVEVQADVDENGKVVSATPLSGPAQLHPAAVQAVTKCRFKPATREGVSLKSTVTIPVAFEMPKR